MADGVAELLRLPTLVLLVEEGESMVEALEEEEVPILQTETSQRKRHRERVSPRVRV
jgi:hypothetical protein